MPAEYEPNAEQRALVESASAIGPLTSSPVAMKALAASFISAGVPVPRAYRRAFRRLRRLGIDGHLHSRKFDYASLVSALSSFLQSILRKRCGGLQHKGHRQCQARDFRQDRKSMPLESTGARNGFTHVGLQQQCVHSDSTVAERRYGMPARLRRFT